MIQECGIIPHPPLFTIHYCNLMDVLCKLDRCRSRGGGDVMLPLLFARFMLCLGEDSADEKGHMGKSGPDRRRDLLMKEIDLLSRRMSDR